MATSNIASEVIAIEQAIEQGTMSFQRIADAFNVPYSFVEAVWHQQNARFAEAYDVSYVMDNDYIDDFAY